jgi:shikimate dehydrogenase
MVNGKTRPFVLLGSPVEHSVSPAMQTAAFRALGLNAAYVPLRCAIADIPQIIRIITQAGGGGNVTLPYKEAAAGAVTSPSPLVRSTNACNTFWPESADGGSCGENTDVDGVLAALGRLEAPSTGWLIVGTGGSARAVVEAARRRGAAIAIQSRTAERKGSFESWAQGLGAQLTDPAQCEVVVNATPLGLNPDDPLPVLPRSLPHVRIALDLVYGVDGTRWSKAMAANGVVSADGREAVVAQGAAAFRCWFPELDPPLEIMRAIVNARLR